MIITSKDLFEAYTKTEQKTGFIQKKAKELNVPRSSIIAALLMSGYKLDEIRRSDENNYKAGLNKYNKWVEEGSPEQTFEVPEVAPAVTKKEYKKPVILEGRPEPVKAKEDPEPVIVSEPEPVKEKPESVAVTELKKDEISAEDVGKLRFRIAELEAENRKAADKIREFSDYKEKYSKLLDEYNLVSADFETVQNTMAAEYQKRLEAEKKLRKAERIICDRIYEEMPDEAEWQEVKVHKRGTKA